MVFPPFFSEIETDFIEEYYLIIRLLSQPHFYHFTRCPPFFIPTNPRKLFFYLIFKSMLAKRCKNSLFIKLKSNLLIINICGYSILLLSISTPSQPSLEIFKIFLFNNMNSHRLIQFDKIYSRIKNEYWDNFRPIYMLGSALSINFRDSRSFYFFSFPIIEVYHKNKNHQQHFSYFLRHSKIFPSIQCWTFRALSSHLSS